VVLLFVQP
jgi:hypothetical protein